MYTLTGADCFAAVASGAKVTRLAGFTCGSEHHPRFATTALDLATFRSYLEINTRRGVDAVIRLTI